MPPRQLLPTDVQSKSLVLLLLLLPILCHDITSAVLQASIGALLLCAAGAYACCISLALHMPIVAHYCTVQKTIASHT
jgi:hypothetical protein